MKHVLFALALLAPFAAGCIGPLPMEDDVTPAAAAAPPVRDRITGMTANVTQDDSVGACDSGMSAPYCAKRHVLAEGRIGLDRLPVELVSKNGAIAIQAGAGDEWSFDALITVAGATEDDARQGLDSEWTWSHEQDGKHAIVAKPTPTVDPSIQLPLLPSPGGPRLVGATYVLTVPAWLVLDVAAKTSNGRITLGDVMTDAVDAETSNGRIEISGTVQDVKAETSNGAIDIDATPAATGKFSLKTSNGAIDVTIPETRRHGYDVSGKTSNGRVTIDLDDGVIDQKEKNEATFRTTNFDARAVQTVIDAKTSNGRISVSGD